MVLVGRPRVELGISDYLTTPNYFGTHECLWSGAHLHHFRCAIICSLRAQTFCLIPSVLSFQSSKGVSPILSRPLAWFLFPSKAHILSKSPGITVYLSAHHCDIILRKRAEAARVELACELPHDSFPSCFLTIRNTLPNKHSFKQVRATRIELVLPRWQRGAQPLYHTRINYSTTFIRSLKKLQASSSRIVNISSRLFLSI